MINFVRKPRYDYNDLLEIIRLLRSPEGCPWDKVQTHESIRRGLLEEAYEAAEAIDARDTDLLKEELGDVLMQVVFHADIEKDAGHFDMDDVCDGVVKKLLFRHPHVFGAAHEDSPESVLVSWDKLKRREKGQKTTADALDAVLFAAVKVGRFCGVDPEEAITLTCEKFIRRFRAMERSALAQGREPDTLTLDEMTVLWNEAKRS